MGEQLPNRDRSPRRRRLIEVFADSIVEAEPLFLDEQHDSAGNELLADRADLVNRLRGRGNLSFAISHAISGGFNDGAVPDNRQRKPR